MATNLVSMPNREVIRCLNCSLTQFRTADSLCRRCKKPLDPVEQKVVAPGPVLLPTPEETDCRGIQVARTVKGLRRLKNLSQRELAVRMGVPRTYISKIENEKAMPTLGSLDRLATALNVHISVLLQDESTRTSEESSMLMADPFLAELLPFIRQMNPMDRSIFLNQARELAASRRRTA